MSAEIVSYYYSKTHDDFEKFLSMFSVRYFSNHGSRGNYTAFVSFMSAANTSIYNYRSHKMFSFFAENFDKFSLGEMYLLSRIIAKPKLIIKEKSRNLRDDSFALLLDELEYTSSDDFFKALKTIVDLSYESTKTRYSLDEFRLILKDNNVLGMPTYIIKTFYPIKETRVENLVTTRSVLNIAEILDSK